MITFIKKLPVQENETEKPEEKTKPGGKKKTKGKNTVALGCLDHTALHTK